MEKILYFFVHLAVPLIIALSPRIRKAQSKVDFLFSKIFQVFILLFLFQWGQYPLVGSFYLRYLLIVLIIIVSIRRWSGWNTRPLISNNWKIIFSILSILGTIGIGIMNFKALAGKINIEENTTNLAFPLQNGHYYISSGGNAGIINNHFRSYPNSQQYAIDINKLNNLGFASQKIWNNTSRYHYIFGEKVYSPCTGEILEIRNNVRDNEYANMQVDHNFGRGNYIEIQCDELVIALFHLQEGSIEVIPGSQVVKGDYIGKVGNSGFSMEPHLHIQAAQYLNDSTLVGVPVSFDQEWLTRNSTIKKYMNLSN